MLNPVHLQTLVVVIRAGSFANAARQIGYTGSAVSQQVAALEHSLQVPLFERDAHSIRPTPTALFLAERAHELLAALGTLEDDVRGLTSGVRGQLRVGGFAIATEQILPRSLAAYLRTHPDVEVSLDVGEPDELTVRLSGGALDVALVYEYPFVPQRWPENATVTHLLEEDVFLLLHPAHALVGAPQVAIEDLAGQTWVSTKDGTAADTFLARMCAAAGFEPVIGMRGTHTDAVRGLVNAGMGIALVSALSILPTDLAVPLTSPAGVARRRVIALHPSARENPRATNAVNAMKRVANLLAEEVPGVSTSARPPHRLTPVIDLHRPVAVAS